MLRYNKMGVESWRVLEASIPWSHCYRLCAISFIICNFMDKTSWWHVTFQNVPGSRWMLGYRDPTYGRFYSINHGKLPISGQHSFQICRNISCFVSLTILRPSLENTAAPSSFSELLERWLRYLAVDYQSFDSLHSALRFWFVGSIASDGVYHLIDDHISISFLESSIILDC